MLEGGIRHTDLGDVLLDLGALGVMFDEEALIAFVGDLHLLK